MSTLPFIGLPGGPLRSRRATNEFGRCSVVRVEILPHDVLCHGARIRPSRLVEVSYHCLVTLFNVARLSGRRSDRELRAPPSGAEDRFRNLTPASSAPWRSSGGIEDAALARRAMLWWWRSAIEWLRSR